MSLLDQQLKRWKSADLITADQADRIRAFEERRPRREFVLAVALLGGFAVALGLLSIVAANWARLSGHTKLALDGLALAGCGQAVVLARRRSPGWLGDALQLVFHGLVLASIALVGQVYQLGGELWQLLLAWSVLTLPSMALGSSPWLGFVWLAGLTVSYGVGLAALVDSAWMRTDHAVAAAYWAPLAALTVGRLAWLKRLRPGYARAFRATSWTLLVGTATAASFAFYERQGRADRLPWAIVGVSFAATVALCFDLRTTHAKSVRHWLLALLFVVSQLPPFLPHGRWPVAAALSFIALFALLAWLAHREGRPRLLHLATALIGLRLLGIYFEVFGSLLDTGLGLTIGGLLTLAITWFWTRQRREFDRELAARELLP